MNNNKNLNLLSKGIRNWNKERPRDSNLIKLTKLHLGETNLIEIDFTLTDLSGTDFKGADLSRADFSGSKLINTNFSGANLTRAKFRNCIIEDSDFSGAKLHLSQFENVSFTRTNLDNAIFSNANFRQIQFATGEDKNSLKGASFARATFINVNLSDVDLSKINLESADFNEANLSLTDLSGANLSKAKLIKSILSCVDLRGANLSDTSLAYADMSASDIRDAKFLRADLTGATLKGVTLNDSDINNFHNANLNQIIVDDNPVTAQLIAMNSVANKTKQLVLDTQKNQFSLSTYTIKIKQIKGGKNSLYNSEPLPLGKFYNGTDLLDFFQESLLKMNSLLAVNNSNSKQDNSEKIVLTVPSDTLKVYDSQRKIAGILGSGKYGIIKTIMNVNGGEITHIQTENEAGVQPYFFLINIPKDKDEGIIILQNIGNSGIKSLFIDFISEQFKKRYPDFRIEVKPFIPDDKIRELVSNGKVKKITFIKNCASISTNGTDILDQNRKSIDGKIELVVSADDIPLSHNFIGEVNDFQSGNGIVDILFGSESSGFEYDTIKLEIDYGGKRRIINLDKKTSRKSNEDITDKVELDEYGNPIFASIENLASEICEGAQQTLDQIN